MPNIQKKIPPPAVFPTFPRSASGAVAGGNPQQDKSIQPWLRVKGGFLTVSVARKEDKPTVAFRHHDVHGKVVHEYTATSAD